MTQLPSVKTDTVPRGLISNLLSVIFEAADTASDTEITRVLVCLFHFIQGKELAGQERACGAFGFTLGVFDDAHRQTLQQLIDAQHPVSWSKASRGRNRDL